MDARLAHCGPFRLALVAWVLASAALPGCRSWPFRQESDLPTYSGTLTKEELVDSLNANIEPLVAWRCTDARIKTRGLMGLLELKAHLAVERPRNFRLRAGLMNNNLADLGSNDERFWFWFDGNPQRKTFTARHEDTDYAQQMLQIPFEPDWLLDALGVIPLHADDFALQAADQGSGTVSLVSERMTSGGRIVRQVILVDARRRLIVAHALFDPTVSNRLIARATLSDHRRDARTGLVLPHRVELNWPQAQLEMTMTFGQVEVNPPPVPAMWAMPAIPNYPVYEIVAPTRRRGPTEQTPLPLHAGSAEPFGAASLRDGDEWSEAGLPYGHGNLQGEWVSPVGGPLPYNSTAPHPQARPVPQRVPQRFHEPAGFEEWPAREPPPSFDESSSWDAPDPFSPQSGFEATSSPFRPAPR